MRTSLVIPSIDRNLAYLGVSAEFENGEMRTSLVTFNINRCKTYLGVNSDFENGEYADQSGYSQHRQRSGLTWSVW